MCTKSSTHTYIIIITSYITCCYLQVCGYEEYLLGNYPLVKYRVRITQYLYGLRNHYVTIMLCVSVVDVTACRCRAFKQQ